MELARDPRAARRTWIVSALLAAGAFALYAWIAARAPVLYYWDPYERIAHHDQLVVRRWLPGLQFFVWGTSGNVELLRWIMCALSAGAVAATFALARVLDERAAWLAALWLATNSLFVEFATMPYQEPLFLVAAFGGLGLRERGARWPAAACFNVACATRYEGWLLIAALALERAWHERSGGWLRAFVASGREFARNGAVVIVLWLVLGSTALLPHEMGAASDSSREYLGENVRELARFLRRYGGIPLLALGSFGWLLALRSGSRLSRALALFAVLDLGLILAVDPFSGSRRALIPIALLALFAGLALTRIAAWLAPFARGLGAHLASVVLIVAAVAEFPRALRAGVASVERHSSAPERVRARQAGLWLASERERVGRVAYATANDEQQLALAAWSGVPLERFAPVTAAGATTTHWIDLTNDPAAFADEIAKSGASVELCYEPEPGAPPRIHCRAK